MRTAQTRTTHALIFAVAVAGSALISFPASAQRERVCRQNCVGPVCNEECVDRYRDRDSYRDRDITVGRGRRDRDVIIEERRYRDREPGVEIRRSRPGVEIEVGR